MPHSPVIIRGHTLLCLQGFRGYGYSPKFTANMQRIHAHLSQNPQSLVQPIVGPDEICQSCPHLKGGCTLHDSQSEIHMVKQDRDVLARLQLDEGIQVSWQVVLERIAAHITGKDLPQICGNCPWLPLGYCAEGIDRLRRKP